MSHLSVVEGNILEHPSIKETVMIVCRGIRYPFPAVWNGEQWEPRVVHVRTTGDDTAGIERDFTDRDVIEWYRIEKRA